MSVRTPASAWPRWLAGWFGAAAIAMVNGIARGLLYERRVGPMRAHYISTGSLLLFLSAYMSLLSKWCPIPSRGTAVRIGLGWTAMTVAFEFLLGRYIAHEPWAKLLEQYDVRRGYVWILIPLWTAIGPAARAKSCAARGWR
jgi:hypothetical protein